MVDGCIFDMVISTDQSWNLSNGRHANHQRLADRTLERVTITKRGRVVGVLVPPDDEADAIRQLHGFMRGSVAVPPEIDLTDPASNETFAAEDGDPHE